MNQNGDEPNLPKLLKSLDEASKQITERIDKGKSLRSTQVVTDAQLNALADKFDAWNQYNSLMLIKLFSDKVLAEGYRDNISNDYQETSGSFFNSRKDNLKSNILEQINFLDNTLELLNLMEVDDSSQTAKEPVSTTNEKKLTGKKVFIIHGHDEAKLRELKEMLREHFQLEPVVLIDIPDGGATTVIEKFEKHAKECVYAIALFTPDDQVQKNGQVYLQARPNVLYELGWFCAKLGRERVLLILKKDTTLFSDFGGVIQKVYIEKVREVYKDLMMEFKAVGLI
jgi:predicted nucleotide-binding protein